jgi:hydroxypyruvate isomerase
LPRFTVNIGMLFAERPFLDRIAAAAAAGFDHVECHFPYDHPIADIKAALATAKMRMNGLNTSPGNAGEFGLAGVPGREAEFRERFDQAVTYARALGASMIHVMAGVAPPAERRRALATYVANLRAAADIAPDLALLLEPLNHRSRPGYLVNRSDEVAELIVQIARPNVKLLFDVFHIQIMEGDILKRFERHLPVVGHVQIAAVPSRAEPDEGEVNYRAVLRAFDTMGYDGLVGLEYVPRGRTEDGLRWLTDFGLNRGRRE